jgi:hypothetical protein
MRQAVSIIHGSRRPFSNKNYQKNWMNPLKTYFRSNGIELIDLYYWSGDLLSALNKKETELYTEHLSKFIDKCMENKISSISIIAKSVGVVIADTAVHKLKVDKNFQKIDKFIKIASPDLNENYDDKKYNQVFSLTSGEDVLYNIAKRLGPISTKFFPFSQETGKSIVSKIKLDGFSHSDFNINKKIESDIYSSRNLFDLYIQLLKGKSKYSPK